MYKKVSKIISLVVLALVVYYIYNNYDDLNALRQINFHYIVLVFFFRVFQLMINGVFIKMTVDFFLNNKKMPLSESFYISGISALGNFFSFFQGGVGIRALYLNKKYNLTYLDFIATAATNYLVLFVIFGGTGIIAALFLKNVPNYFFLSLIILSFGGFILMALWPLIKIILNNLQIRIIKNTTNKTNQAITGAQKLLFTDPMFTLGLFVLFLVRFSAALLINFLLLKSVSVDLNMPALTLYTAIAGLSIIINITPAAIGFREVIFVFVSSALIMTENQIVEVAIVDRALLFIVLVFYYFIFKIPYFSRKFAYNVT